MRRGLAKLLREARRLAAKRRYRRRGSNEQPNIQSIGLSFCSTAFVLIQSVQLAARHIAKTSQSQFWGSRLRENINMGGVTGYRGEPLIFQRNIPDGGLLEQPAQGVSLNRRFQFDKSSNTPSARKINASRVFTRCGHNPKLSAIVIRT